MSKYVVVKNKTRQEEFRTKLNALLEEYGVEMEVKSEMTGYDSYSTHINFYSHKFEDVGTHFVDSTINFDIETVPSHSSN